MRKGTAIGSGILFLLIYLIGFVPYIIQSLRVGGSAFLASLGLTAAAVLLAGTGGIVALFLMRRKLVARMEQFNSLVKELAAKKGIRPSQVSLLYVLSQKANVTAVIGPRSKQDIDNVLKAVEVRLTQEEIDYLLLKRDTL